MDLEPCRSQPPGTLNHKQMLTGTCCKTVIFAYNVVQMHERTLCMVITSVHNVLGMLLCILGRVEILMTPGGLVFTTGIPSCHHGAEQNDRVQN
jgi:hypothetical protein